MNKKSQVQVVIIIIVAILFLAAFSGVLTFEKINFWLSGNPYIVEVSLDPEIIDNYQSKTTLKIIVENPKSSPYNYLEANLKIEYNDAIFSTRNWEISDDREVNLGDIAKKEKEVYYVDFNVKRHEAGEYPFSIILYDDQNKQIDSRKIKINVQPR